MRQPPRDPPPRRPNTQIPPPEWFEAQAARILAMIGALYMPEIGGKKFASGFRDMLEKTIQKAMVESTAIVQEAANELASEMKAQAKGAARAIRQEAAHVRETFAPYTGNNEDDGEKKPADTDGKPDPTLTKLEGDAA